MGKITILPDVLCNQIAAGEVIERPAAVVKELLENSLDAGGSKVSVSLLHGGRKEIRIADNGCGMSHDDALMALERHATSKIRSAEDLHAIHTLGFRGEALPSIASVSRFELITREPDAVSGTHIRIESGVLRDVRETGCPAGTTVTVRDLFHNIPVRRKFLRSVDTEMGHVSDRVLRLALAHPAVHLQLFHQERLIHDLPRSSSVEERAARILGAELAARLRSFDAGNPSLHIHGLASPPDIQRVNAQYVFLFVNGRPVSDRMVSRAIAAAYDSTLPRGRFPVVVLFLEVPPELVDVNVHPTKGEVRFRNPGEVLASVSETIRRSLENPAARRGPAPAPTDSPPAGPTGFTPAPAPAPAHEGHGAFGELQAPWTAPTRGTRWEGPPVRMVQASFFPPAAPDGHEAEGAAPGPAPPDRTADPPFSTLPVIGRAANAYILLEAPDGVIFIDQHAAHERILFDALTGAAAGAEPAQRLLRPVVLDLLPGEAARLRRLTGELAGLGFDVEPFGGDSFVIHSVPSALAGLPPETLLREALESVPESSRTPGSELLAGLSRSAACHRAVRAGQRLEDQEVRRLLESLDRTRISATCPHGRPLWFKLTLSEIARSFHRT